MRVCQWVLHATAASCEPEHGNDGRCPHVEFPHQKKRALIEYQMIRRPLMKAPMAKTNRTSDTAHSTIAIATVRASQATIATPSERKNRTNAIPNCGRALTRTIYMDYDPDMERPTKDDCADGLATPGALPLPLPPPPDGPRAILISLLPAVPAAPIALAYELRL